MTDIDTATRLVIAVLLAGVWQAPLFALASWLVLRICPRLNATTRYSVFAAALFAGVLVPIVTAAITFRGAPPSAAASGTPTFLSGSVKSRSAQHAVENGSNDVARSAPIARDRGADAPPASEFSSFLRPNFALPRAAALAITILWLTVAAIMVARLVVSFVHLERLKTDALPLPVAYRAGLPRWAAATKGSRQLRLCRSREIAIPVAVGLGDAMILLPEHLLEELEPSDIDSIVLHELAHLRRADDWLNALQRLAQAVLFFNPAILWLAAQLDLEREVACDDWVLHQDDALRYATCLTKVVETTRWPYRPLAAPGAFVTRRGMSIRIERVLAARRDIRLRTSFAPTGAVVIIIAVLGIGAALASPSIAYTVVDRIARPAGPARPAVPPRIIMVLPAASAHVAVPQRSERTDHLPRVTRNEPALPAVASRGVILESASVNIEHATSRVARAAQSVALIAAADARSRSGAAGDDAARSAADARARVAASGGAAAASAGPEVVADATTPDYVDELARAGYSNLSVDELAQLKSIGVSAAYIRGLQRAGFAHLSVDDLVQLRALAVDPTFVRQMRERYGSALSIGDIAGMRALGVSSEYVDALAASGLTDLSAGKIGSLRALGVTPGYIRGLARCGYPNLSVEQIVRLKALDIDSDYLSRAAAHGFHHLSIDQLIRLKTTGVL